MCWFGANSFGRRARHRKEAACLKPRLVTSWWGQPCYRRRAATGALRSPVHKHMLANAQPVVVRLRPRRIVPEQSVMVIAVQR